MFLPSTGSSQKWTGPWAGSMSTAKPWPPWQDVQPKVSGGCERRISGGWVLQGWSAASKPFQFVAWWQVVQRSARPRAGTQICCMPEGTVLARSAPNFSPTCCLNWAWYQRHSCSRSLRRKRIVATTRTRPMIARTGRSRRG